MPTVGRPRRIFKNFRNRLTAHARNADCIAFFGRNAVQTGGKAQRKRYVMLLRVALGMGQRPLAKVGTDHAGNTVLHQQRDRQLAVVGADVGKTRALRHERSNAGKARC